MRALLLAGAAVLGWAGMAQADTIVFNGLGTSDPFNTQRGSGDAPLGSVTFNQDTTIDRFGVYDAMSGAGTQTFYIFDGNARRLYASAPKAFAGDGSTGISADTYKVSDLFSFTFAANTTYLVGATASVDTGYYVAFDGVSQNGVTVAASNANVYLGNATPGGGCCSTGLVFYTASSASPTLVPEPASLALLGIGVAGVAAVKRRRAG